MSTQKRFNIKAMRLDEISSVDRPAQTGAVCVLIKSANGGVESKEVSYTTIRKNADSVSEGGKPDYPTAAYEDAMFLRAEELARQEGISKEQALAKHHGSDEALRVLARAAEVATYNAYAARTQGRLG